jgi:hypothetical protein
MTAVPHVAVGEVHRSMVSSHEARAREHVAPRSPRSRRARFMALSTALTGDADLPSDLAASYVRRLDAHHPDELDALLGAFESGLTSSGDEREAIATHVITDDALWSTAHEVISIWMTSRLPRVDAVAPETVAPEEYFQSRLWSAIRAHPQGLSGGYFGYWHYEPEL